tara:strand:+ start:20886 stop:21452 length:567 start_codon:yes stop_codon:yes gene_type:complete
MNNFSQSPDKGDKSALGIGGTFKVECYDAKGQLKWSDSAKNAVTDDGLDSTLNLYFRNGTTLAGWALGLITGPGPTLAAADTHAVHAGWTEFTTYSETERNQWSPNATTTQQLVNPSLLDYNITGSATVSGVFIAGGTIGGGGTDADTKGSVNGTPVLWAHALFSGGDQAVTSGDILRVTYTVSAASA